MKKIIMSLFLVSLLVCLTGCEEKETSVDPYSQYNYTSWTNTSGYVIQILENSCKVGKDGKQIGNVCKFEANAGGSGVAKITVCDSNGFDCDSSDLPYRSKLIKSFYIFGNTWYYSGDVIRN